jgi:hypothetical protein
MEEEKYTTSNKMLWIDCGKRKNAQIGMSDLLGEWELGQQDKMRPERIGIVKFSSY